MPTRRQFLKSSAGAVLIGSAGITHLAQAASKTEMLRRPIPSSGELVPAIGMGTSGSFQIPAGSAEYAALKEVVKRFFEGGATLIDTAPTYGNAEDNLGTAPERRGIPQEGFHRDETLRRHRARSWPRAIQQHAASAQDRQSGAAASP
jgi:diketogulonate reductase-like aldo/keto reductase